MGQNTQSRVEMKISNIPAKYLRGALYGTLVIS